ncbi:hypothetical protein ACHAXM_000626 [Skeletonema potamos]
MEKRKCCITPEQTATTTTTTTPRSSSSPPPLPPRKRPPIEVSSSSSHDDEVKKSTTTCSRPSSINVPFSSSSSSRCHDNKRQRTHKKEDQPTTSSTTTTTTTVRFAPTPHQTHIIPRWTTTESSNSWYSKTDIVTFRYQEAIDASILRQLIAQTPTIHDLPQDSAVYRGLERLLSESILCEINNRRKHCVWNVLMAQRLGGLDDVEGIARVCMACTEKAVAWALTLGSM